MQANRKKRHLETAQTLLVFSFLLSKCPWRVTDTGWSENYEFYRLPEPTDQLCLSIFLQLAGLPIQVCPRIYCSAQQKALTGRCLKMFGGFAFCRWCSVLPALHKMNHKTVKVCAQLRLGRGRKKQCLLTRSSIFLGLAVGHNLFNFLRSENIMHPKHVAHLTI